MLRSVTAGVALSVMAAACALVEPPPPPATNEIAVQVTNADPFEVELAVTSQSGIILEGAVQPSRLPPRGTSEVTFYLPISGDWTITVNGTPMFMQEDVDVRGCPSGVNYMEVSASGAGGIGCSTQ